MLTFALPWCLLFLPLPWLVRRLLPAHREPKLAVKAPFTDRIAGISGQQPAPGASVTRRSRTQWVVLIICWCLVIAALARPQWLEPPITRDLPMRDLLLTVDLSGSMSAEDFVTPEGELINRLEAVKNVLNDFLTRREGDRVGLILFGSAAFVQVPFTADLGVVSELLDEAQVGMLGPRTMLGDAMGLGITLFKSSETETRVMIALTDGNDTGSLVPPERAAEIASDEEVVIHTIAIGDPAAVGEQVLDEASLMTVSETTGGVFYRATDQAGLESIYAELDQLNPRLVETVSFRPRTDLFQWPLGLLVLIVLLSAVVRVWQLRPDQAHQEPIEEEQERQTNTSHGSKVAARPARVFRRA